MDYDSRARDVYLSQKDYGQWLQIQQNTFTNWVNECLRGRGIVVEDLRTQLSEGVNLVALVESLSRHGLPGTVTRPNNQYEKLQNITIALEAVRQDGVRIVNIDSSDIVENNLKLILGLVWQLILKYQVGESGSQSKSFILKWLQAILPDAHVTNLTTDWNDGIVLHALLDFCKPGLSANWRTMDKSDRVENCRTAMKLARQHFNVPLILRPEDLASPELDEKSLITYLSYFIKVGGPGYVASLEHVSGRTKPLAVSNFTTDWQDGRALINLVRSAGGRIGEGEDSGSRIDVIRRALQSGEQLGVAPLLKPEDVESQTVEHLGMMTYSVQFLRFANYIYYTDMAPILDQQHLSVSNTFIHVDDSNINHINGNGNHTSTSRNSNNNYTYNITTVTEYRDDESTLTSTINAPAVRNSNQATFELVSKTGSHAPRIEAPPPDHLKVDTYSTGVIMESTIHGPFDPDKFKVEATSPNGRVIKITGDGYYAAQFGPSEIGRWNLVMSYDDKPMERSPVDVCDPSQVMVKDIRGGFTGKNNYFHVDCTRAGPGDLGVDVSHQGRLIPSNVTQTDTRGLYKVRFTPYDKGPHAINVHFNRAEVRDADFYTFDQEERQRKAVFNTEITPHQGYVEIKASCDWEIDYLTGGPFICHVSDHLEIPVYKMVDGTVCGRPELIVDCSTVGEGRLTAEVTFHGLRYPCKVKEEADRPNVYRVRFKPKGAGTYKVWLHLDGTPVKGSPFTQEVAELEGASVFGDGLNRGVLGKPVYFTINPRGFPGQVSVTVEGPSRTVPSKLEIQDDQTILATYHPVERGPHKVNIMFDGKNIKGSPFHVLIADPVKVRVSGGWRPLLDDKGVIPLIVRKEKVLPFDVSEAGHGELTADVQGPNGRIPVAIDARNDGKHSVVFTPREPGTHFIHVNWGGFPLANSPYQGEATVGDEVDGRDDSFPNVRLVHIPLKSPTHSTVPSTITTEHPGSVAWRIQDEPDSAKRNNGFTVYRSPQPEPAKIRVVTRPPPPNQPIRLYQYETTSPSPSSPISKISQSPPIRQTLERAPQKVVLSGKGLKEAVLRSPAYFQVDGTKADHGTPTSHLESVKYRVPVSLETIRPNVYRCSYTPIQPGAYLLYINWNNKPLRGSPFKVNVRAPVEPAKVKLVCNFQGGIVGRDVEIKADTRDAGKGILTAKCTDPKGGDVPVRVSENNDGTLSLRVKPLMAGRHRVDVHYNEHHVKGSPFHIDIKEWRPTGTVKVWGPGIENGIIPTFQSTFWVETTGAGAGDMRVKIMGPRGAFNVKMRKASEKEKIYQCFYDPVEPGVYTVHVQWSGAHVEGSPFTVLLGENDLDLARMQDELNNIGPDVDIDRSYHARNSVDGHNLLINGVRRTSLYHSDSDGDRRSRSSKKGSKKSKNGGSSKGGLKRNGNNETSGDLLY